MGDVIQFKSTHEKRVVSANKETVEILDSLLKNGYMKEVLVIANTADGKIGIMGNLVKKEDAIRMLKNVIACADELEDVIE